MSNTLSRSSWQRRRRAFFLRLLVLFVVLILTGCVLPLYYVTHGITIAGGTMSQAIHPADETCPFRDSPLYRSIYMYPTPNFSLNLTGAELSQRNSIYSPNAGKSTSGIIQPYPWIEWDQRTREERDGWGHYKMNGEMGQYTLELIFREMIRHPNSCLQTNDPESAKLFYVPYLPSMEFHQGKPNAPDYSTTPYGQAIHDAIEMNFNAWEDHFGFTSKYWRRRNGSDHVLIWSEPLHGYSHPRSRRGNHHYIHTQRQLRPPIAVVVEMSTTFVQMYPKCASKNILVPYPNPDGKWYNGNLDRRAQELSEKIDSRNERPALYYYSAGEHGTCASLRKAMNAEYQCTSSYNILDNLESKRGKLPSFPLGMRLSHFCPCPGGDSPSAKRNFDAVLAGCIPLVLSHDFVWPYSIEYDPGVNIDPNNFSIRLKSRDFEKNAYEGSNACGRKRTRTTNTVTGSTNSQSLQEYLNAVPPSEIQRLKRGVEKAADNYSYYRKVGNMTGFPDNPLRDGVLPDGGAAHLLLDALAVRAGGNRWMQCKEELQLPDEYYMPDIRKFTC